MHGRAGVCQPKSRRLYIESYVSYLWSCFLSEGALAEGVVTRPRPRQLHRSTLSLSRLALGLIFFPPYFFFCSSGACGLLRSLRVSTENQVFEGIAGELDSKLASSAAASVRGGGEGGNVVEEATVPIEGMKPGTSGLRKKVGHGRTGFASHQALCASWCRFFAY